MKSFFPFLLSIIILATSGCDKASAPINSLEVAAKGIHGAALSDSGTRAVIGSIYHGGSYWNLETNERVYNWNHKENDFTTIVAADFSHTGNWALTANPFDMVLWDANTGRGERFWTAPGEILDVELGPNANMALLGLSDHSAVIFNVKRGGILRTFQHNNRVRSVDLSRDGSLAITGSEDYTANLWDVSSGKKLSTIKHNDDVQLVKLSPNGQIALSMSKYDKALLWNTNTGTIIGELPLEAERLARGLRFTCARFNEDGSQLLTGRPDQFVELWETATLKKLKRWKLPKRDAWKPSSASVVDVAFKSDGGFTAIASNGYVHHLSLEEN